MLGTIHVTSSCIALGKRQNFAQCPIALALINAGARNVCVSNGTIEFTHNLTPYTYIPDPRIVRFIRAYDAGKSVEPFSFPISALKRLKTPTLPSNQ